MLRVKKRRSILKQIPTRQRKTLAKQIRELAKTDTLAASLLAERGKIFSEVETILHLFYRNLIEYRKVKSGEITSFEETMREVMEHWSPTPWTEEDSKRHREQILISHQGYINQIGHIITAAIDNKDSEKFREIAEAIDLLKKEIISKDPWRSQILIEKQLLESWKKTRSIGEWARIIGWPAQDAENGFPQLRRLLKELEVPIRPSRQPREK